jgi:hypothetical protein
VFVNEASGFDSNEDSKYIPEVEISSDTEGDEENSSM